MKINGKKILLCLAIIFVAAIACAVFVACDVDDVKEITITPDNINVRIGEFDYADYTVTATYDSGKTVEVVLTEDMIAAKDRVKFYLEGEYEIEVTYLNTTSTIKVNVRRNVFEGAEFNDLDVVYNGDFYTVEVKNVPEGTTVTYPSTNRFRNAGTYQATAILRKDAYEMKEMIANVTIRKADYDLSATAFEDKTEDYDGTAHLIEMTGKLPLGLYVDYTITREGGREEKGNTATNAGVYRVEARFSGDYVNYNVVENKVATLNIRQAEIDVSKLKFENKTVVYDRTKQTIELEGTLPRGVAVVYSNNEHVDAGAYEARAKFYIDDIVNYAPIPDMIATLTIQKADYDMSAVRFNGTKVTYDGKEKKIEIQGQLPTGVTVSYDGNVGKDAGTYQATATFSSQNVNYNNPNPLTATLIIDKAVAPMDQIEFERRRFISQKSPIDEYDYYTEENWEEILQDPVGNEYLCRVYNYDPYLAAKEYVPQNVPTGLNIASVKFKKVDGWLDDLTEYDGVGAGYLDDITEDGYYVVVVNFDGGINYTGVSPVKTLIRVDTLDSLSNLEDMIYDAEWFNPETKETSGAFMKAYTGIQPSDLKTAMLGHVILNYCECNVFQAYAQKGEDGLISEPGNYLTRETMAKFQALADSYVDFIKNLSIRYDSESAGYVYDFTDKPEQGESPSYKEFLTKAQTVAGWGTDEEFEDDDYYSDCPFSINFGAYIPLNDNADYVAVTNYDNGNTVNDYYQSLADVFGFENASDFFGADKITGSVFDTFMNATFRANAGVSVDSFEGQIACAGGVYQECGEDMVFIFPYVIWWYDGESYQYQHVYLFCAKIDGVNRYGALIDNAELLLPWRSKAEDYFLTLDENDEATPAMLDGRCSPFWDLSLYKMATITKVVTENGVEIERAITSGKDFVFIPENEATENLIHEEREVYKFLTEIPGNCAERQSGYDGNAYRLETAQAIYSFCDCDIFASVIKADGDTSNITNREDRDDHAQMTAEVAGRFDELTALYHAFISNYVVGEDVVNEWKIGISNRNYNAYKAFFEYASDMFLKSNRNMGKNNEYVLSKSVIVGMNHAFSLSINGSGYDYTVDQYRLTVAKLFGFEDADTFTAYVDALANALVTNARNANVDSTSARLIYDGAILTENGYYVLPYAIKSETSTRNVLAFIFVDAGGTMAIWINDARNAFNTAAFGSKELASADKYRVTINGRCILFDEENYIMKEDLSKKVSDMIDNLQNFAINRFIENNTPENCGYSNQYWDDENYWTGEEYLNPYMHSMPDCVYYYCDCDPFSARLHELSKGYVLNGRSKRQDHADMTEEVAYKFDALSTLYKALLSKYTVEELQTEDGKVCVCDEYFDEYRRFFRYAKDMFASVDSRLVKVDDYLLSDSIIIGLNKDFAISTDDSDITVREYRMMVAKLFGYADTDSLTAYTEELARLLVANEGNASVDGIADRLTYDGAVFTTAGCYVFPYSIANRALEKNVLAFIIVDENGTVAIWINNADSAFASVDFLSVTDDYGEVIFINGRCTLFETAEYTGYSWDYKNDYIVVEKVKTFQSAGDFLIYSPFSDEEGFEVYWFSVYDYELEVVYEDADSESMGTVQKGFYTLINVASSKDVYAANQRRIENAEAGGEDDE